MMKDTFSYAPRSTVWLHLLSSLPVMCTVRCHVNSMLNLIYMCPVGITCTPVRAKLCLWFNTEQFTVLTIYVQGLKLFKRGRTTECTFWKGFLSIHWEARSVPPDCICMIPEVSLFSALRNRILAFMWVQNGTHADPFVIVVFCYGLCRLSKKNSHPCAKITYISLGLVLE